ncbi:MAG: DUF192 domain-containing protein [Solirubrobacterales bacterium]
MDPDPKDEFDNSSRLANLPRQTVAGVAVPVATSVSSRLLGLSHLDSGRAGTGLLIPGCRSVHTFGMRFAIDIFFLDGSGNVVRRCLGVPSRRCLFSKKARSVLELVPDRSQGGEVPDPGA